MDERRRAAWRALALGPVWVPRADAEPGEGSPPQPHAVPRFAATAEAVDMPPTNAAPAVPATDATLAAGAAPGPVAAPDPRVAPPAMPLRSLPLDALREQVAVCPRCRLCQSRTRTVFGQGDPRASWMFVGEAPGAEEDARGEPFVGPSGRLLDAMLASVGLHRARDVYIANVVKCRPPGNRNPQADEVASCEPYLREQIELVRPALLVLMGRFAAQSLLRTAESIGSLRGRLHRYEAGDLAVPAIVTYHPAYLLRTPVDKAKVWRDLCSARAEHTRLTAAPPR